MSAKYKQAFDKTTLTSERKELLEFAERALIRAYQQMKEGKRRFNPLLQAKHLADMRYAITGEYGKQKPQTPEGRAWGDYVETHLKQIKISKATAYRRNAGWIWLRDLLPLGICDALAEDERMVGVNVNGFDEARPLGKYTVAIENEAKAIREQEEFTEDELETIFDNIFNDPESKEPTPPYQAIHNAVMRRIRSIAATEKKKNDLEYGRRKFVDVMAYMLRGFEFEEPQSYEPLPDRLPEGFESYIIPMTAEEEAKQEKRKAEAKARLKRKQEHAVAKSEKQRQAEEKKAEGAKAAKTAAKKANADEAAAKKTAKAANSTAKGAAPAGVDVTAHGYYVERVKNALDDEQWQVKKTGEVTAYDFLPNLAIALKARDEREAREAEGKKPEPARANDGQVAAG